MSFNHYAKIKRILNQQKKGWYIKKINNSTSAKNFRGETVTFPHYYRIYDEEGISIKYCKFQQVDRLAKVLNLEVNKLPIKLIN